MAMEIINKYSSYAGSYTKTTDNTKKTTESSTTKETSETNSTTRKTAADELSYLSGKYKNYSFLAANYTKGMKYGSSTTVNVAISPAFLAKMANDPELEKEYEENIAAMQECDEQNIRQVAAGGWHVVAQGWVIDKDGGISKWGIVQKDDKKSHLQTMSENAVKIRERNAERKEELKEIEEKREENRAEKAELKEKMQEDMKEKAELKEKMQEAGKVQFGDKFKDAIVIGKADENVYISNTGDSKDKDKDNEKVVGWNLDIKA